MKTLQIFSVVAPLCALFNVGVAHAAPTPTAASSLSVSADKTADALLRFASLQNVALDRAALNRALQPFNRPLLIPTNLQIQSAATTLKWPLNSGTFTLQQMRARGGAYLVKVRAPDEWMVVAAVGSSQSVVQSAHGVAVMPNAVLQQRMTSDVLMSGAPDAASRVLVVEPVVAARVATIGEALRIRVPIRNRGAVPLQVQTLHASCSCTSDDNSPRILAAGESGELSFKVDARESGKRMVSVLVGTNDPLWPRLTLAFEIETPQVITPPTLFLSGQKGQVLKGTTDLVLPPRATVSGVSSKNPLLLAKLVDGAVTGAQRIAVEVAADAPAGQFADILDVELSGGDITKIVVPVEGFINNDITVSPRMIALGEVTQGIVRRSVVLQAPEDAAFSIEKIETSASFIQAKAGLNLRATSHVVEIEVLNQNALQTLQGRVTLTLSGDREIDIDVSGAMTTIKNAVPATSIAVGQRAPDFERVDANGQSQLLSARRSKKNVLLTFFPKCFTGGCTAQLSSLRDEYSNFQARDTEVIAVSVDDADEQRAFAAKYNFPFAFVPDTQRIVSQLYGATQTPDELSSRLSILIDKNGLIRWIDRDIHVSSHGVDVLKQMRTLGLTQ